MLMVLFTLAAFAGIAGTASAAGLSVTPNTWDTIGLRGNTSGLPASPNMFPVGAEVCNTTGSDLTDVSASLNWDSANPYIDLDSGQPSTVSIGALAAGECTPAYFTISVAKDAAAWNTTRAYHIEATATGASGQTPAGRELYVEKLIAQNRNTTEAISGPSGCNVDFSVCDPAPTNLVLGNTYTYKLYANTSTAYEQLEAYLTFPGSIFRVKKVVSEYEIPAGGMVDAPYADACGWDPDPASATYMSCTGPIPPEFVSSSGKAGGDVVVTYTVEVIGTGTGSLSSLIYDFSGSSFHYNSDFGTIEVNVVSNDPETNLVIDKSHTGDFTQGQTGAEYTLSVTNNGPDASTGTVTVTDTVPTGLTATAIDGPGWNCVLATLTCERSDSLAAGDSYPDITLTVDVANDAPATVINSGTVSGGGDPTPNTDDDPTTIESPLPDVEITKTADPTAVSYGDTVTYTLKAKNNGPDPANNVTVTDPLPTGVSFVSADSPCVNASGTVTCELGTLQPGEEVTLEVKVKVDPATPADPNPDHLLDVQKVEAQIDLEAGEQKTVSVTCPSGYFASDGSVRIDQVDHGTGDWTTQQVLESRASSLDTWQGTVKNTAMGRAQAKIFAVCIKQTTSEIDGHTHDLTVSAPITFSATVAAGPHEAILPCPAGQVAIQPGFSSTVPANLVYSQPEGAGWKFVLDVTAPADVTFSIRCMSRQVTYSGGHDHSLDLKRIWTEVTVEGNTVNEAQLTCSDGSKGIVAGWDLDPGLVSLGNDPRPVTRTFKLYNPTMGPLTARLSLLCLGNLTTGHNVGPVEIINTAYITTTSDDENPGNDQSSATITVDPIPNSNPDKPVVNNPIGMTIGGSDVVLRGNRVRATIKCSGACSGRAKLISIKTVKVGKKKVRRGSVLAKGTYKFNSAGKRKLNLKVTKKGRIALKRTRKARLKLSNGQKKLVRIR
jgi:uncharacterized repeat protein (TIGR01451 family)